MSYLVRCECGLEIPVAAASAGTSTACECGRLVLLPSLRLLKELPQSDLPPRVPHSAHSPAAAPRRSDVVALPSQARLNVEQLELVASLAGTMRMAGWLLLAAGVLQLAGGLLLLVSGRSDVFLSGVASTALAALTLRAARAFGNVRDSGESLPPLIEALSVLRSLYLLQAALIAIVFIVAMFIVIVTVVVRPS